MLVAGLLATLLLAGLGVRDELGPLVWIALLLVSLGLALPIHELYAVQTKLKNCSDRRELDGLKHRLFGIGTSVGYKVRCYDKLGESNNVRGKLYWHEIWRQMGFSLEKPIWRVEYEIRRDFLKS